MIDRHYVTTIDRHACDLASKTALMVHSGVSVALMREVAVLAKTIANVAEVSLEEDEEGAVGGTG